MSHTKHHRLTVPYSRLDSNTVLLMHTRKRSQLVALARLCPLVLSSHPVRKTNSQDKTDQHNRQETATTKLINTVM